LLQRRDTLKLLGGAAAFATAPALAAARSRPPNIVLVVADDLGWGDLGCYGGTAIATPNLDRMARQGLRMTDFYASANVCTPSRAGLMTGRYPIRTGLGHEVIQAKDTNGLPQSEVSIARALKPGYVTGLFGKWHLGHVAPYWPPMVHGFDRYVGIPYSNDMQPLALYRSGERDTLSSEPVDQTKLTEQFFDAALGFIADNRERPFFAAVMLSAPHLPLRPRDPGRSPAGAYGDVVGEIDAGMGRLFQALMRQGLDRDTIVIFTSDNGPWFQGSSGPFRDRKGGAGWEGGYRVPFIVRSMAAILGRSGSAVPPARMISCCCSTMNALRGYGRRAGSSSDAAIIEGTTFRWLRLACRCCSIS
jgi:arylsulfatase A